MKTVDFTFFDSRLNRIKSTLNDIRNNLEGSDDRISPSRRYDTYIENHVSFRPPSENLNYTLSKGTNFFQNLDYKINNTKQEIQYEEKNPYKLSINPNYKEPNRHIYSIESSGRYGEINNKENEIDELKRQIDIMKITINELQKHNTILQMEVSEKNNEIMILKYNENKKGFSDENRDKEIIQSLEKILSTNKENLVTKINEITQISGSDKMKADNFISKVKTLYTSIHEINSDKVSLKYIWRWIKNLIKYVSDNNIHIKDQERFHKRNVSEPKQIKISNKENQEKFVNICENLLKEYNLRNPEELNELLYDLLRKNEMNKRRVDKLKKILFTEPNLLIKNTNENK